ncbi:MAG: DUF2752 domain-containing protein [Bacteroidales bacterium]|nr:DUF2752 domain-containing protein [Bacteroidales bacterium]
MLADWLEAHALPCVYRRLTGICCPFCGIQRSVIALFRGDFLQSVMLYPALLPLMLSVAGLLVCRRWRMPHYLKWIVLADAILVITGTVLKNIGILPK